jgi:hypothetical protein
MQIVHTDNRPITADCDSGKRQIRPFVREGAPYQKVCNCLTKIKYLILSARYQALYQDRLSD